MAFDLDLMPDVADDAFAIDQEGCAFNPHVFTTIQFLQNPHAIGFTQHAVFIGQQPEGQIILGDEIFVSFDAVFRSTDDDRARI